MIFCVVSWTSVPSACYNLKSSGAYHLYEEAWPGIGYLARKARFSVAVAADVYRGILGKIISNGYNVFTERAFLTRTEMLRRLPMIWVRTQNMAS